MKRPRVSVVLPTYNQAAMLPRQLEALNEQTFQDFELIAVNDGSTDETQSILEAHEPAGHQVRLLECPANSGLPAFPINTGIALAAGELWTWVSSDNWQYPRWLERLVEEIDRDPAAGAVFGAYDVFDGHEVRAYRPVPISSGDYRLGDLARTTDCVMGPAFLIRRDVWRAAGPHEGGCSHDYGHWLRIEEVCMVAGLKILYVNEALCAYHVHDERVTVRRPERIDAQTFQRAAIERRRNGTPVYLRELRKEALA